MKIVFFILSLSITLFSCVTIPQAQLIQQDPTWELSPQSPKARGLMMIIHGANGTATTWPPGFERILVTKPGIELWDLFIPNWPHISDSYFTAPRNAYALGRQYGKQLADASFAYEVIHLIGSSMAGHLIHGLISAYREEMEKHYVTGFVPVTSGNAGSTGNHRLGSQKYPGAIIHVTLLDPFSFRGFFQGGFGVRHFGSLADYTENYFSKNDPVPFTNRGLRLGYNINIDAVIPPGNNSYFTYYHDYPIFYYMATLHGDTGKPGFRYSPFSKDVFSNPVPYFNFINEYRELYGSVHRLD